MALLHSMATGIADIAVHARQVPDRAPSRAEGGAGGHHGGCSVFRPRSGRRRHKPERDAGSNPRLDARRAAYPVGMAEPHRQGLTQIDLEFAIGC